MAPVRLRQFELIAPIASGGMGTVYFSRDVNLAREVAVKLMQADMAKDAELVRQFTFEHGLLGSRTALVDDVAIAYPDGTIQGKKDRVRLRFDTTYMQLAAEGKL